MSGMKAGTPNAENPDNPDGFRKSFRTGRRILLASFLVLAACLLFIAVQGADDSDAFVGQSFNGEGSVFAYYVLTEDGDTGTVKIKAGSSFSLTNVEIPESVVYSEKTYTVTQIDSNGFKDKSSIQTVSLPASVTWINNNAFYSCSALTTINLGNVEYIDNNAFYYCSALTAADLSNVGHIGTNGFCYCTHITSVSLNNLEYLGNYAFSSCSGLTSITLPESITYLGDAIFSGCSNLTSMQYNAVSAGRGSTTTSIVSNNTMPSLVVNIGTAVQDVPIYAFYNLKATIHLDDGSRLISIGERAFASNQDSYKNTIDWDLPDTVQTIGNSAFAYANISIGGNKNITLPASLTSFGTGVYTNITLTSLTILTDSGISTADVKATTVTIGDGVSSVSTVVSGSTTTLNIGRSVTTIDSGNFTTSGITTITVTDGNTHFAVIGGLLYELSDSVPVKVLKGVGTIDVDLPDTVTEIGSYAFYRKTISHIDLNSVQILGEKAFYIATATSAITIPATVTTWGEGVFQGYSKDNLTNLTIVKVYSDTIGESAFKFAAVDSIRLYNVTSIPTSAFESARIKSDLTIPDGVLSLGNNSFKSAIVTGTITIPSSVSTLGSSAFESAQFESIVIPTSITSFGASCFKGTAVSSVTFSDTSDVTIGAYAFQSTALISVTLTKHVVSVGASAFADCGMLSLITLNESDTEGVIAVPNSIGASAFDTGYCTVADTPCLHIIKWDGSNTDALDAYVGTTIVNTAPYVLPDASSEGGVEIEWTYTADDKTLTLTAGTSTSITSWDTWAIYKTSAQTIIIGDGITTTVIMDGFTACKTLTIGTAVTNFGGATNLPYLEVLNFNAVNHTSYYSQQHEKLVNIGTLSTGVTLRFNGAITKIPANLMYYKTVATVNLKTVEFNITKGTTTELGSGCLRNTYAVTQLLINTAGTFTNPSYGPTYTGQYYGATLYIGDVTTQPTSAFYGTYITGISYGPQVTSIAANAFQYNHALKSVTLSANCTSVGNLAFNQCTALQTVTMPGVVTLGDNVFLDCTNLQTVSLPSATTLGHQVFRGCTSLERAEIPLVASVGNATFMDCRSLTYADISSLTSVISGTFSGCTSLEEVILNDEGCTIGDTAFSGCTSLSTIDLSHVTNIGIQAFYNCSSLVNQSTDLGSATIINISAFSGTDSASAPKLGNIDIHSAIRLYSGAFKYAGVTGSIAAAENCQFATENLATGEIFYGCTISDFTFNNESQIPSNALSGIVGTYGITLVKVSGLTVFSGNTNISSVTIADGYRWVNGGNNGTDIVTGMFRNCTNLASLTIQGDRTGEDRLVIGQSAFEGCTSLATVDLSKVKTIGDSAFNGCTSLFANVDNVSFTNITINSAAFRNSGLNGTITLDGCTLYDVGGTYLPFGGCNITSVNYSGSNAVTTYNLLANISSGGYTLNVIGTQIPDCRNDTNLLAVVIGSTVTGSGNYLGFTGCTNLASVTFNATGYSNEYYTSQAKGPFYGLEQTIALTIGNGVTNIPDYMFAGIRLSGNPSFGAVTIGAYAFSGATCGAITIAEGATIGNYAFYRCSTPSVTLGNGVTLGNYSFSECTATSVSLGTVAAWGNYDFSDMANLSSIIFNGTTTIGTGAFARAGTGFTAVILPETLTTIGDDAFYSCTRLAAVTIPASVTLIGDSAFKDCTALVNLTLTDIQNATAEQKLNMEGRAFSGCALTSVTIPSRAYNLGNAEFGNMATLRTATVLANLNNAPNIFTGSGSNQGFSVTFGDSVTVITSNMLRQSRVSEVDFGGVRYINSYAFENCTSLTSVSLPSGVIGEYAFRGCTGFTSISIPAGADVRMRAFESCPNLASVTVLGNVSWGSYVFYECTSLRTLVLPIEYNVANTSLGGLTGVTSVTFRAVSDGVGYDYGSNPANRVWYNNSVSSVAIEEGVRSIGDYMFYTCETTTLVSLPSSVNTFGSSAFADSNVVLGTVNIVPGAVVRDNAFYNARGVTAFNVDGQHMDYASDASGVMFNKEMTQVVYYPAGRNASSYTVPDTVTSIRLGAFAGAVNLTSVVLPSGLSNINSFSFYGCTGLTVLDLPDGLRTVGSMAFSGCTSLTSIYFPSSITNLGLNAFKGINFLDSASEAMNDENGFTVESGIVGYTFVYLYSNNGPVLGQKCTVKYITGENIADVDSVVVAVGDTVGSPGAPNAVDGYDFGGWFANEGCTTPWDFGNDTVSSNTFIYAKAAPEEYTITLHDRTGPDSQSSEGYTVHFNDAGIDVQIPNVDHKYMIGIYYKTVDPQDPEQFVYLQITGHNLQFVYSDPVSAYINENNRWIYRGNIDLYVQWDDMLVTIQYYPNGAAGDMGYDTVRWNDEYHIRASNTFAANTGYDFAGWNTVPGGNGEAYMAEALFIFPNNATYGQIITLYAQWRLIPYDITYNTNGGADPQSNPYTYNYESATINLDPATWAYATFAGWYDNENLEGEPVTSIPNHSTGNITLYAKWEMTQYVITYNLNGGTNAQSNPATYTYTTATIILVDATKDYYTFGGWYGNAQFTGDRITLIPSNSHDAVELYAKWTPVVYTITYNLNGGTNAQGNPASFTVESEAIQLANATKDYYTFGGWYVNQNLSGDAKTSIPAGSHENVVLYAKWTPIEYTITYNLNGGTNAQANPASYTVETEEITLLPGTKDYWTFGGWFDNGSCTGEPVTTIAEGSHGDITLYAYFIPITYTITYNLDGGSNSQMNPATYTNRSAKITLRDAYRNYYDFDGWYDNNGFEGDPVTFIPAQSHGDVVLYAKWVPIEYTISYNLNGGTNAQANPATFTVESDEIELADATWANAATFAGWYGSNDFQGGRIYTIPAQSHENVVLYAKWDMTQYAITYHLNGGENGDNPATYTYTTPTITLQNASKTGYAFNGWYADEGFQGDAVTQIALNSYGNKDLYAKFTINQYTISFNSNEGSEVTAITQNYGTQVSAPEAPTKQYYDFVKWQLNGVDYEFTTMPAENITLDAVWTLHEYTITYIANGVENNPNPTTYTYETPTITLTGLSKTGFNWNGWYQTVGNTSFLTEEIPLHSSGDITLRASFSQIDYTVNLNSNGGDSDGRARANFLSKSLSLLNEPTKTGYHIVGYYTAATNGVLVANADRTLVASVNGYTDESGYWAKASTTTLYTRWEPDTFNIAIDSNGGTEDGLARVTYGASSIEILSQPVRAGYTFAGFLPTSQDVQMVAEADGSLYCSVGNHTDALGAWMLASDTTLYAKWTATQYTIPLDKGDGDTDGSATVVFESKPLTVVTAPTKAGYEVEGYYNSEGAKVAEADGTLIVGVDDYTDGSGNWVYAGAPHLTAHWTAASFTVTLDKNTGATNGSATVTFGSKPLTIATAPTKAGYHVTGYYTAATQGQKVAEANGTLIAGIGGYTDENGNWIKAENSTLYAYWTATEYAITLDKNGGTADGSATVTFDSKPLGSVHAPVRANYHVTGYYTAASDGTKVADADGTLIVNVGGYTDTLGNWIKAENVKLFAYWAGDTYDVKLDKNQGETDGAAIATYGSGTLDITTVPARTGFDVVGYYITGNPDKMIANADGTLVESAEDYTDEYGKWIKVSDDVILYAHWEAKTYDIVLDKNDGDANGSAKVAYGGNALTQISPATKTGYDIWGYFVSADPEASRIVYTDGKLVPGVDGYTDGDGNWIRTSGATLYAKWWPAKYTIVIDKSGGDTDGYFYVEYNDSLAYGFVNPHRVGYDATGAFFLDEACTPALQLNNGGALLGPLDGYTDASGRWIRADTCTVYAQWAPKNCDLLIKANGGDTDVHFHVTYGTNQLSHQQIPVLAGNDIEGYYTDGENPVKVINADFTFVRNVQGYTDADGKWICDGGTTLVTHWSHHTYTVVLDRNEGTADGSTTVTYAESTIGQLTAPVRAGYVVVGYNAASGERVISNDGIISADVDGYTDGTGNWIRAADTILYTEWAPMKYRATLNPGEGSVDPTYVDVTFGESYKLPEPKWNGHYFSSWKHGDVSVPTDGRWNIADNVTLTVEWSDQPIWQVAFDGGEGCAGNTEPVAVLDHGTLTFPQNGFTKEGYSFAGWTNVQHTYQPGDTLADITIDMWFSAVWTANVHQVTYKLDGVVLDGNYAPASYNYATSVTVLDTYQKKGYYITEWSTQDATIVAGSFNMPDRDVVLIATSTPWHYDVPLLAGDIGFDGSASVDYGSKTITIISLPSRPGYSVAGFDTYFNKVKVAEANGTLLASVEDGGPYTDAQGAWDRTGEYVIMSLYAEWSACNYDITLDPAGGKSAGSGKVAYDRNTVDLITAPSKTGYHVDGYYIDQGLTTLICTSTGHLQEAIDGYTTYEGIWKRESGATFYTKWAPDTYTVTLDKNGGTVDGTATATFDGKPLASVQAPVKANYHVSGYYTAATDGIKVAEADGTLIASVDGYTDQNGNWIRTSATTLYAQWTPDVYAVTLDKNGGTADGHATATYDGKIGGLSAPTRTGYSVEGYYTAATQGTKVAEANGTLIASVEGYTDAQGNWFRASGATLFTYWTANTYKVTFDAGQGTVTPATMDIAFDSAYELPTPTYAEHYFATWMDGQTPVAASGTWKTASDVTLTADWRDQPVWQITFVGGEGATGTTAPIQVLDKGTLTFPANGFAKTGHHFAGWSDGTATYQPNDTKANISASAQYTALWEANTHTVTYKLDNNVLDGTYAPKTVAYGSEVTVLAAYPKTGYTVTAWATQDVQVFEGKFAMPDKDVVFTATSTAKSFDVNLAGNGGDDGHATIVYDGGVTIHMDAFRYGYDLVGYALSDGTLVIQDSALLPNVAGYTDADGKWKYDGTPQLSAKWQAKQFTLRIQYLYEDGSEAHESYVKTMDTDAAFSVDSPEITGYTASEKTVSGTIDPHFEPNLYTVSYSLKTFFITFDSAGGSNVPQASFQYGADVVAPADPTREGYDFKGWDPALPAKMPAQNLDVTAKWTSRPAATNGGEVAFVTNDDTVVIDVESAIVSNALADQSKTTVSVSGNGWEMTIPKDIVQQAHGEVSVSAQTLDDNAKAALPDSVKARVEGKTVYSLNLSDSNGAISFVGKKIKVSLPYELPAGKSADSVKVYYINGESLEEFDATYDADRKVAVFETEHFSEWFVDAEDSPSGSGGSHVGLIVGIIVGVLLVAAVVTVVVLVKTGKIGGAKGSA